MFKQLARNFVLLCGSFRLFLLPAEGQIHGQDASAYHAETNIIYCTVDGKDLKLNAFLPSKTTAPVPAIVEIHGGWWSGGEAAKQVKGVAGWQWFMRDGLAIFSIQY